MPLDQIKSSGLLELYVIGDLPQSEKLLVENAIKQDESIRNEVKEIEKSMKAFAFAQAIPVPATTKPMLFAALNFQGRIENGEVPVIPPSLDANSKISDFSQWLEREDMQEPDEFDSMYGRIINSNEEKTTLIVWLRDNAPDETHTDEYEKFLIVEGSCDIKIDKTVHSLKRGDFLSIPLFVNHSVEVTSDFPCKIILERAAA